MPYLTLIRIGLFALSLVAWNWLLLHTLSPALEILCIVGTMLLVFPTVWVGRRLLDAKPTTERVAWVTTGVHAALLLLLGAALIEAIQTAGAWRGLVIPFPPRLGGILAYAMLGLGMLTVLNLALRGWGAPWAIALTRRLTADWLYAWTRNPMTLATFALLVALGLWLQSALFIVWGLLLVAPALVAFLKIYEERELEIRFGDAYRAYKAATPFLWPRRPRRPEVAGPSSG